MRVTMFALLLLAACGGPELEDASEDALVYRYEGVQADLAPSFATNPCSGFLFDARITNLGRQSADRAELRVEGSVDGLSWYHFDFSGALGGVSSETVTIRHPDTWMHFRLTADPRGLVAEGSESNNLAEATCGRLTTSGG